jgi:hypothetical protein
MDRLFLAGVTVVGGGLFIGSVATAVMVFLAG